MAITIEDKQQFEIQHQNLVQEAVNQAVVQAEQEIDSYLTSHPGYRVPLGMLASFMTTLAPASHTYGHWPRILLELRCLYKGWVITEEEEDLDCSPSGRGYLVFENAKFSTKR